LVMVVLNGGPWMCSSTSSSGAYCAAWWNRPEKTANGGPDNLADD
jgi:uncharacterized protein YodC (DUF2158 family)